MKLSITKAIKNIVAPHFEKLLLTGAFPEINFEKGNGFRSYNMFEYADIYARYAKLVDKLMKEKGLDSQLGIFTRKSSKNFLALLDKIVSAITEQDIRNNGSRFVSFADMVRGDITGNRPEGNVIEDNEYSHNAGDMVACDFCNEGEETMGGLLIGSYAICGDCAKTISHPEEITERFDENKTFRQNVLEYRKRAYGFTEAITKVSSL